MKSVSSQIRCSVLELVDISEHLQRSEATVDPVWHASMSAVCMLVSVNALLLSCRRACPRMCPTATTASPSSSASTSSCASEPSPRRGTFLPSTSRCIFRYLLMDWKVRLDEVCVCVTVLVCRYWEAVLEMLWPRFELILEMNIHSIRNTDPQKLGVLDTRPHYVGEHVLLVCGRSVYTRVPALVPDHPPLRRVFIGDCQHQPNVSQRADQPPAGTAAGKSSSGPHHCGPVVQLYFQELMTFRGG